MLVRINRDPNATDATGGAASAQPNSGSDVGASAGASQGAEVNSQAQVSAEGAQGKPASAPNFKELGERLNRGEILSDDEHAAFMESLGNGEYDKQTKSNVDDDTDDDSAKTDNNGQNEDGKEEKVDSEESDPILEAMQLTGAKEAKDLPGLIKGLRDAMTASGGKLGEQVKSLSTALETQHSILTGIANGDPNAMAEFQRITGRPVPENLNSAASNVVQQNGQNAELAEVESLIKELEQSIIPDDQIEDQLDPEAAKRSNKAIQAQLKLARMNHASLDRIQKIHESNLQKATMERAQESVFNDMSDVAVKFADDYNKISPSDIRKYVGVWEKEGILHPKLEPLVKTLQYSVEHNVSMEDAHKILHFEKKTNHNPIVQKALADQRNKLLNQQPANSISQRNNGGEAVVTMQDVEGWMKNGNIPDEYMGENGLDFMKLPKNIQQKLGL